MCECPEDLRSWLGCVVCGMCVCECICICHNRQLWDEEENRRTGSANAVNVCILFAYLALSYIFMVPNSGGNRPCMHVFCTLFVCLFDRTIDGEY